MKTLLLMLLVGASDLPLEAPLPPSASALSEPGRYKSSRSFDDIVEFFQKALPSDAVRWTRIVNLPSIKAEHLESLRSNTHWEGINIYEARGEVRFYVIARKK
jgi:hypothetical protein